MNYVREISHGLLFLLLSYSAVATGGVVFNDDLESGNLSKVQNGYKWSISRGESGESPKIVSDIARSGRRSIQFTFLGRPSGEDSWSEQRFDFGAKLKEVYIKYYLYYPDGTEGLGARYVHRNESGNNNKFFRMWDDDYFKYNVKVGFSTRPSQSMSYVFPEKGINAGGIGPYDLPYKELKIDDGMLGRWIEVRMHVKTDSGKGDGIIQLYLDGKEAVNAKNVKMYPKDPSKNYFLHAYFLGWSNSGFSKTTHIYMDDLMISNTPFDLDTVAASPPIPPVTTIGIR